MIAGIGVDAARISRFSELGEGTLKRIYSKSELQEYELLKVAAPEVRASFLASRFAVKEAFVKALGTGFCGTTKANEISTVKDETGKPAIVLEGDTLNNCPYCAINLSITHEDPLAIAFVVIEGDDNGQK